MPSPFSISNFKHAGKVVWFVAALIAAIEWTGAMAFPGQFFSHEVDQTLYELDQKSYRGSVLFLGDSVGRQIGTELQKRQRGVVSHACNAAIETAGQFFLFRRYAERNPIPERVVLMMGNPMIGNLSEGATENFVQRCFLRWSEIIDLAFEKKDPLFTAWMIAYKCFPSLRYRFHLQRYIPGLKQRSVYVGALRGQDPVLNKAVDNRKRITAALKSWLMGKQPAMPSISSSYFEKMVSDLDRRQIQLSFLMPPMSEALKADCAPDGSIGRQIEQLEELAKRYGRLEVIRTDLFYPSDWFSDGTHLKVEHLPEIMKTYRKILFPAP